MPRARRASITVGSGDSGNDLAGRNAHDVARASSPSGTAAHVVRGEYAGVAARAAGADGEFVTAFGQIDPRYRLPCARATAARTAARAAAALRSSAGATAAAVGEGNLVAARAEA